MSEGPRTGLWAALRRRWADERRASGAWRASVAALRDGWDYLRDSTPSRRRQRYGDLEFDWEARVNTTAANVVGRTRLAGALAGGPYQPIPPAEFRESLAQLPIRFEDFTFIDLGSGKGRALLLASEYPFRRIVGVELLPELHAAAVENIAKFGNEGQKCRTIETVRGDAREYEFPPEPLVVFFFNPFPGVVIERVLERLEQSLRAQSRPAWIVYHNPVHEGVFVGRTLLERIVATHQFVIFRAKV